MADPWDDIAAALNPVRRCLCVFVVCGSSVARPPARFVVRTRKHTAEKHILRVSTDTSIAIPIPIENEVVAGRIIDNGQRDTGEHTMTT